MADANTKITIFFTAQGGTAPTGWTENFWTIGTNLQNTLTECIQNYIKPRATLLGKGAQIEYVRVSNVPPNRLTRIQYLFLEQGLPTLFTSSPADDYDPVQVDLLWRFEDALGHRRQAWMGGLPDSVTDSLLAEGIKAAFVFSPACKAWQKAISTLGYGIRSIQTHGTPNIYQYSPIVNFIPIMIRNRKRGRPFDLFRGRRLA